MRETTYCSTLLCIRWLIVACALTKIEPTTLVFRDNTPNNCLPCQGMTFLVLSTENLISWENLQFQGNWDDQPLYYTGKMEQNKTRASV